MRAQRFPVLRDRTLRRASRAQLEQLMEATTEGLRAINALIDAGADHPWNLSERGLLQRNEQLLRSHLAKLQA